MMLMPIMVVAEAEGGRSWARGGMAAVFARDGRGLLLAW